MLRESRKRLHDLHADEIQRIAESLCFGELVAAPVYECVKVYARVNNQGQMTYARHVSDLGTAHVSATDITNRFTQENIKNTVLEALTLIETHILPEWPYSYGSSSWVQLEILDRNIRQRGPINSPAIVFRKAVRLSSSKKLSTISSTPLVERVFSGFSKSLPENLGRFVITYSPKLKLKNLAGTGILSENLEQLVECKDSYIVAEKIAQRIIRENLGVEPFLSPGLLINIEGETIQVVSDLYRAQKALASEDKKLPLPIVGLLR